MLPKELEEFYKIVYKNLFQNFFYIFAFFYVLRCYFVRCKKKCFLLFLCYCICVLDPHFAPYLANNDAGIAFVYMLVHISVCWRGNRLHMCARVCSGCFLSGRACSLRKRNPFLLQNNAFNCDLSDANGRSKYNIFKCGIKLQKSEPLF